MNQDLHRIPNIGKVEYTTEPALQPGSSNHSSRSILVGQVASPRTQDQKVESAILLGSICELTRSSNFINWGVWLDTKFPHAMLIVGKRGSGKSYDLGIIAEGLCATEGSAIAKGTEKFSLILFDTQSQFWTLAMSKEGVDDIQQSLIEKWDIQGQNIHKPTVFRPKGTPQIHNEEEEFALRPSDLEAQDWIAICGLERFSAMGQCLIKARNAMTGNFSIKDMIDWIDSDEAKDEHAEQTRQGTKWRIESQDTTGLFDENAEDICSRLGKEGSKSIIQLADLEEEVKALIVAVIMRKLLDWAGNAQRKKKRATIQGQQVSNEGNDIAPRIWTLIDEAHLICPSDKPTAARPVVIDYVKRGRDAGLSLVLATQQPSAIDSAAISQSDIVVIHKLTIDGDIDAATARMPSSSPKSVQKGQSREDLSKVTDLARVLDEGQSIFADSECNRSFILNSRPRITPHGGGEPPL